MTVNSIAAGATLQGQSQVSNEVSIRVLKMAQDQQKSVVSLIEGAAETAAQIQQAGAQDGAQHLVDVSA
ncbi:MAG: hypothetical protein JNG88_06815 [Phycisphaerales bacterium]|nr:hypothetical protein [Phycisphaerales bacterium]